jgi:NADH:ubiquinone oxidoreductase subunit F (NADH-binding)/NADH:ubiquinone oxidoreductase subunit E
MAEHREATVDLERRRGRQGERGLESLRRARERRGRLAPEDVDLVAEELGIPRAHLNGAATFFADLGGERRGDREVRVCDGAACFAATGGAHVDRVAAALEDRASSRRVYCLGYCFGGPAALDGDDPMAGPDLVQQLQGAAEPHDPDIPYAVACDEPVVLARITGAGPEPWSTWREAVAGRSAGRVLDELKRSRLRGRGGAGFPAAVKWTTAAEAPSDGGRYIVANGDEGDPGSFADRLLMERDANGVLEGMALAGMAIGASRGFVYVRSEYPRARDVLRRAIEDARRSGDLGANVHGSGVDFDVEVFEGAGSYVAGEETSLIHSMEGLRGGAAPRPPFPAVLGLFGRPTVVNNVETMATVPWIVANGGDRYAALGIDRSRGTKLVCLNERFARPGVYEVEFGMSLRRICDQLGGGLRDGRELRALQVGGPLGGFLGPEELDVPLSFEDLGAAGVDLGHGSLVAFDERTSPAQILVHTWKFIADESCGTCFPCRIGSRRGLEIAERIAAGSAGDDDLGLQDELLDAMGRGSLCGFGQGAPVPVRGLMRIFPELGGSE